MLHNQLHFTFSLKCHTSVYWTWQRKILTTNTRQESCVRFIREEKCPTNVIRPFLVIQRYECVKIYWIMRIAYRIFGAKHQAKPTLISFIRYMHIYVARTCNRCNYFYGKYPTRNSERRSKGFASNTTHVRACGGNASILSVLRTTFWIRIRGIRVKIILC